jgi:predicted PurR-regulated permease PerM
MDTEPGNTRFDPQFVRNMLESSLRIAVVFLLLYACYDIVRPFMIPLTWGAIIAIAAFPMVHWLEPRLGGRRGLASSLVTLVFVLVLVLPTFALTESLLGAAKSLSTKLTEGTLQIPPPRESVAEWPLVGPRLYAGWVDASQNAAAMLEGARPEIRELTRKLVSSVGSGLAGVGMFVVSLLIAGGFMAYADGAGRMAHDFFVRVGGVTPGGEWRNVVVATVRNVLKGVVGVAVIQAILCAIGLFAIGIPGAPIWTALILFLAIAQLPALLVVLPCVIWAWNNDLGTVPTALFTVWILLAGASDNLLKPILMGRGLDVPMPVILIGAIGGMIAAGIVGLFAGAVVLSIWYLLYLEWMKQQPVQTADTATVTAAATAKGD